MSSIQPDAYFSKLTKRLETTQKVQKRALWTNVAITALAMGVFVAAGVFYCHGTPKVFEATLYTGGLLLGANVIPLIVYVVARYLHCRAEEKLTGEVILAAVKENMDLIDELRPTDFRRLIRTPHLKNETEIVEKLKNNAYAVNLSSNLMFIDPALIDNWYNISLEISVCGSLIKILSSSKTMPTHYDSFFDLYVALSKEFGEPHPLCYYRDVSALMGGGNSHNKELQQAIEKEITQLIQNLDKLNSNGFRENLRLDLKIRQLKDVIASLNRQNSYIQVTVNPTAWS